MALRKKWENPTKELKEQEKHGFYTILNTCERPLIDEIGKQWYQTYSRKVDPCPIKLMLIISYLCNDNDEEDDVNVISDSDTEHDSDNNSVNNNTSYHNDDTSNSDNIDHESEKNSDSDKECNNNDDNLDHKSEKNSDSDKECDNNDDNQYNSDYNSEHDDHQYNSGATGIG